MDIAALLQHRQPQPAAIQMLQIWEYRNGGIDALEAARQFRLLFNDGRLYCCGLRQRQRTWSELVLLLMKNKVVRNEQEAEKFITEILGSEILYNEDEYFVLKKKQGENCYFLESGSKYKI